MMTTLYQISLDLWMLSTLPGGGGFRPGGGCFRPAPLVWCDDSLRLLWLLGLLSFLCLFSLVSFWMQDSTRREAVSWKLSAAFFWWVLVILNVFVCNMLLQNACKHHQNYVRKTDENGPKMVPKPLQNWSWRSSGGLLGATLETRCFQDIIFYDFGSILAPPLGPVWAHVGHHFFDVFLRWLFDGRGLHLCFQKTSKIRPKRESKSKPEHRWFWCYLQYFSHI